MSAKTSAVTKAKAKAISAKKKAKKAPVVKKTTRKKAAAAKKAPAKRVRKSRAKTKPVPKVGAKKATKTAPANETKSTRGKQAGARYPQKLTTQVHDRLVNAIADGAYEYTAAALCNITRQTLNNWKKKGQEDEEGPYRALFMDMERAAAEAEMSSLTLIRNDFAGTVYKAQSWFLTHRFRERWGNKVEVASPDHVTVSVFETRSSEDLRYYAEHGHFPEEAS